MARETWISAFYPAFNDRFMVVLGGDAAMVEAFNRGEFGIFEHAAKGAEKGTFKLEESHAEQY